MRLLRKKRDEFYAKHKKEQEELLAKRYSYYERYYDLRNEIKIVEQLRRSIDELMKDVEIERLPQKKRELNR